MDRGRDPRRRASRELPQLQELVSRPADAMRRTSGLRITWIKKSPVIEAPPPPTRMKTRAYMVLLLTGTKVTKSPRQRRSHPVSTLARASLPAPYGRSFSCSGHSPRSLYALALRHGSALGIHGDVTPPLRKFERDEDGDRTVWTHVGRPADGDGAAPQAHCR